MRRFALRRALPVALTLSLFLGWLVIGVVHHHADQPGCELCKAMHSGIADVSRPGGTPAPCLSRETISLPAPDALAERSQPHPRGRAPPLV